MDEPKGIGLALGGGAARGFAHIGVLKVLEREKIAVHAISGTSIGALVGAMYAHTRNTDLIRERFESFMKSRAWRRSRLHFLKEMDRGKEVSFLYNVKNFVKRGLLYRSTVTQMSVIPEEDFLESIWSLLDDVDFNSLAIPLGVLALDLDAAEQVLISRGSVRQAVAASCSIPGIFPPIEVDGARLVDGGWVNVVPVSALAEMGAQVTVAVDVAQDVADTQDLRHGLDVLFRTNAITRQKLKELQLMAADVVIRPPLSDIHWADFGRLDECVRRGEEAAQQALPAVREVLGREEPPAAPLRREGIFKRLRRAVAGVGSRLGAVILAGALAAGLAAGCDGGGERDAGKIAGASAGPLRASQEAFERVGREVVPAVVNIQAEGADPEAVGEDTDLEAEEGLEGEWSFPGAVGAQAGSGLVIGASGYILTTSHVIEGAKTIRVRLADGKELEARRVGTDPTTDLAVIKVDPPRPLPVARFGNSDAIKRGQWAIAIGNPFGLGHTLTVGVVSAAARSNIGLESYENFIQTDAAINPGNSGGPLVDIEGCVIGINNAVVAPGQGIGFAIPINLAKEIQQQIIATGHVTRGWLGVGIRKSREGNFRKAPRASPDGLVIEGIYEGSPAQEAGLRVGDLLRSYGERRIDDVQMLQRLVAHTPVGRKVEITVERKGKTLRVPVIISARSSE